MGESYGVVMMCKCKAPFKANYHLDGTFDNLVCSVCNQEIKLTEEQKARAEAMFGQLASQGKMKVVNVNKGEER